MVAETPYVKNQLIAKFIIGSDYPDPFEFAADDINSNNVINVLDNVLMINIILEN